MAQAALARKAKIMGFGHRVYGADRRRPARCAAGCQECRAGWDGGHREDIEHRRGGMAKAKNLYRTRPARGSAVSRARAGAAHYTPFFVASRITGWAHVLEQQAHKLIGRSRGIRGRRSDRCRRRR